MHILEAKSCPQGRRKYRLNSYKLIEKTKRSKEQYSIQKKQGRKCVQKQGTDEINRKQPEDLNQPYQ